jgi:hypothetical protein
LDLLGAGRFEDLVDVDGAFDLAFVSGFLARKIPAPPVTSAPTSWAKTAPAENKQIEKQATERTSTRKFALALILVSYESYSLDDDKRSTLSTGLKSQNAFPFTR